MTMTATVETDGGETYTAQRVSAALARASGATHEGWALAYRDDSGVWQWVPAQDRAHLVERCGVAVERVVVTPDVAIAMVLVRPCVDREEDHQEGDGCGAWWVSADVSMGGTALRVSLYAARPTDGRPGLEPCGDALDAWCDLDLRSAVGDRMADSIGRRVIAEAAR